MFWAGGSCVRGVGEGDLAAQDAGWKVAQPAAVIQELIFLNAGHRPDIDRAAGVVHPNKPADLGLVPAQEHAFLLGHPAASDTRGCSHAGPVQAMRHAKPAVPPASTGVITVTPVQKWPSTWRNRPGSGSNAAGVSSGDAVMAGLNARRRSPTGGPTG